MKKTIIFFFLLCVSTGSFSQNNLQASAKKNVETTPDILAKFPGGMAAMYKFFKDNLTFHSEDIQAAITGELVMTFIIDTEGKISDIDLKKGVNSNINSEATRILKLMPAWIPAQSHGQLVNTKYSIFLMVDAAKLSVAPMFN